MKHEDHLAVDALARNAVIALNPSEVVLFDLVSEAFWQAGGRLSRRRTTGGLQFDLGSAFASALAPVALAVGAFALRTLHDIAAHDPAEAPQDACASLRVRLTAPGTDEHRVALPKENLARLRTLVAAEARQHLAPERADDLANALVARIAKPAQER